MRNKIALITGGTSGVGLSIVKELAKNKFDVYFIGTNEQIGLEIEAELNTINLTKSTFIQLDLSDLGKVKEFASNFKNKLSQLDFLGNIAGVFLPTREEVNGIEKTFAIGYLSAFILCNEFIDLLEKSKDARIVNVAGSPLQILKPILKFDDFNFKTNYSGMKATIATVHAKTVLTKILSEKYNNISINSFHPGIVKGNLTRNMPWIFRIIFSIAKLFMAKTSKTGIYVSLSEDIKNTTGKLFVNKKAKDIKFKENYKDLLWKKSEELIKDI